MRTRVDNPQALARLALAAALLAALWLPGLMARSGPPIQAPRLNPIAGPRGPLPLAFEANAGQTDATVRYLAHTPGGTLYFTPSEVILALPATGSDAHEPSAPDVLRWRFVGADPEPAISAGERLPGKVNYFKGNDPAQWRTGIPTYAGITYTGLYPGIDLRYEGTDGRLKSTYTIAAGADPGRLRWRYLGAETVTVDSGGNLRIRLPQAAEVAEHAPVAWQEIGGQRVAVSAAYDLAADGSVGFTLGAYDPAYALTIDPELTYSTYFGGSYADYSIGVALDGAGNMYIGGFTASPDLPTTPNAYQPHMAGGFGDEDAWIAKISADGTTVLYATFLGGAYLDFGYAFAVDAQGNAYITGQTYSSNFPTLNAFQPNYTGYIDAFVTKLNPQGSALVYSTYLGGNDEDEGLAMAVDSAGHAYVSGTTLSDNFPILNAYQPQRNGLSSDLFLTKMDVSGSALVFSTYLGGNGPEEGAAVAVDGENNIYLTGRTWSGNFPTANPFQPQLIGLGDAFVTKMNAAGTALIYSTYLGGTDLEGVDKGYDIAVDAAGNAYVAGETGAWNFPIYYGFQAVYAGFGDGFVAKFTAAGGIVWSSFLGGSWVDSAGAIAVDPAGNVYVTGTTLSDNFPILNAIQSQLNGTSDVFVTRFTPNGAYVGYSTYLGGSDREDYGGTGIAINSAGAAVVTGHTESADFPLVNPLQSTNRGSLEPFITVIQDQLTPTPTPQATNTPPPTSTPTPTHTPTATPGFTLYLPLAVR